MKQQCCLPKEPRISIQVDKEDFFLDPDLAEVEDEVLGSPLISFFRERRLLRGVSMGSSVRKTSRRKRKRQRDRQKHDAIPTDHKDKKTGMSP